MPEELSDAEINHLLERFDQTDPKIQRGIIARFIVQASQAADLRAALSNAPDRTSIDDDQVFILKYLLWHGECVEKGLIAPKPAPVLAGPKREAVRILLCRCCAKKQQKADDEHGRCVECLDMVPTRRGGWRQLGVYDG